MADKKMYVIRTSDGLFWCGYKYFDKQLRKAKIYHSLKFAQEIVEQYADLKPEILEVEMAIVSTTNKKCDCFQEIYGKTVCYGTKEREECSCGGDKGKCNFYPEYRK